MRNLSLFFFTVLIFMGSVHGDIIISEVMTNNVLALKAADGTTPDWLELHNDGAESVALGGYFLSDNPDDLNKWELPAIDLPAGGYLVVFASGADLRDPAGELHASFQLKNGGEFLAVVDPDKTSILDAYDPEIPQLSADQSYGVVQVDGHWVTHFFSVATPGIVNGEGTVAEEVVFSISGKAFTDSMEVTLSSRSGSPIKYTTDGRAPALSNEMIYGDPIQLSETTILSAAVAGGPAHQEVYFNVTPEVLASDSNLPIVIVDAGGRPSTNSFREMFIAVIEPPTGAAVGEGEEPPRTTLTEAFSITSRGHIRIRGSSTSRFPKPSYRIEFQNENGDDRVVKPLGLPAESDWILSGRYEEDRALVRNEFVYELSNQIGRYAPRTRFCEVYLNTSSSGAIGAGDYIGLFSFMESIKRDADRVPIDELTDADAAEPEVTGGYIFKVDRGGSNDTQITGGGQRVQIAEPDSAALTSSQRSYLQGYLGDMAASFDSSDPETGYPAFIDVDAWIDVHLLNMLMLNVDALRLSSFFHKPRGGKVIAGPIWDFNISSGSRDRFGNPPRPSEPEVWRGISGDRGTDFFGSSTQGWWGDLFDQPDFQQAYCDRWNQLRQGAFSTENVNAIIDAMVEEVREAQIRNEERWDEVPPKYGGWDGEINHLKEWLATRSAWIDNELVAPPSASPSGGALPDGSMVTLTAHRAGSLYYTTDGTDPRVSGGGISPAATMYASPFALNSSAILTVREHMPDYQPLRDGPDQEWSAPARVAYVAGETPATAESLTIAELMYHPSNPNEEQLAAGFLNDGEFEFIELLNRGSNPIDLLGVRFDNGIQFAFEDSFLMESKERAVLVSNRDAFVARYGDAATIAGVYTGRLANSGETLELIGADAVAIQTVKYNDKDPWPTTADGDGFSLVLTNLEPGIDASDAAHWSASSSINGSPGDGEEIVPGTELSPITGIAFTADGGVRLLIEEGTVVGVQYSTDLLTWEEIATANGPYEDNDPARRAAPVVYYRTIAK